MRRTRLGILGLAIAALGACSKKEADPVDQLMVQASSANAAVQKTAAQTVERIMNPQAPALPQAPQVAQRKSGADLSTSLDKYVLLRLDDRQRDYVFLYTALGGQFRGGMEELLNLTSAKYYNERDAFRKKELEAAEKPRILSEVERHKQMRYFAFEVRAYELQPYDFTKKGFPLTTLNSCRSDRWRAGSGIELGSFNAEGNCIGFSTTLPAEDLEIAKRVEALRSQSRHRTRGIVYAYAEEAGDGVIAITATALRMQVYDVKDLSNKDMDSAQPVADFIARRPAP